MERSNTRLPERLLLSSPRAPHLKDDLPGLKANHLCYDRGKKEHRQSTSGMSQFHSLLVSSNNCHTHSFYM